MQRSTRRRRVCIDGLIVPGGHRVAQTLGNIGHAAEFIKDLYRHRTTILAVGEGAGLVENAGVPARLPNGEPDPGMLVLGKEETSNALSGFVEALAQHRHFARAMDPPPV